MKVICDNCGAMYKIPDEKLVKPVNKATCRQCGHRMLIPRPRRGADPDERTLVTAVPPTPPPAPVRADSGPPTTPIHEIEEKTAPTGGRRTEETRWVRNDLPSPTGRPRVHVGGGAAAATPRPQPTPQAKRRNAFDEDDDVATQVGPDPTLTYTPREDTPPPRPAPPPAPAPAAQPAELDDYIEEDEDEAPPPKAKRKSKKKRKAAKAPPAHDPRGDMGLALFGVMVALLGVTILAVTSVLDASISDVGMYAAVLGSAAIGLMLAVGGGVGAFLVLLTSGRGSKPAWRVASILLAMLLAIFVGVIPAAGRAIYDVVGTGMDAAAGFGELMARATPPPPVEPIGVDEAAGGEPDDGDAMAAADDTDAPVDDTDVDTEAADENGASDEDAGGTAEDDTSTRSTSTRSTSTRNTTRNTSTRNTTRTTSPPPDRGTTEPDLTDDEERDLPDDLDLGGSDKPDAGASNLPASPPLTAIDVMVKSNTGVKRCFFEYQKVEGKLPKRVDVKFTIKPNGDATSISTTQKKLEGTQLESCLIRSIRSITFPPSQKGTTLTFPFVFG